VLQGLEVIPKLAIGEGVAAGGQQGYGIGCVGSSMPKSQSVVRAGFAGWPLQHFIVRL
jgi:hypothetical protein